MRHILWNVWEVNVQHEAGLDRALLQLLPMYLHDSARGAMHYNALPHGALF